MSSPAAMMVAMAVMVVAKAEGSWGSEEAVEAVGVLGRRTNWE